MKRVRYEQCNKCKKFTSTRRFNLKHQDFKRKYRVNTFGGKPYTRVGMYIYHTQNYSLCEPCTKKLLKLVNKYV